MAESPELPTKNSGDEKGTMTSTPNYSYIYQTANTKTSVFLITGPKHWQRGRVITEETQEAQKGKSENMPSQRGKKIETAKAQLKENSIKI